MLEERIPDDVLDRLACNKPFGTFIAVALASIFDLPPDARHVTWLLGFEPRSVKQRVDKDLARLRSLAQVSADAMLEDPNARSGYIAHLEQVLATKSDNLLAVATELIEVHGSLDPKQLDAAFDRYVADADHFDYRFGIAFAGCAMADRPNRACGCNSTTMFARGVETLDARSWEDPGAQCWWEVGRCLLLRLAIGNLAGSRTLSRCGSSFEA